MAVVASDHFIGPHRLSSCRRTCVTNFEFRRALGVALLFTSSAAEAYASGPQLQRNRAVFRITLLGTGNPRPSLDRFGPSTLVEAGDERVVIDAGRGTTERLFQIDGGPLLRSVETVVLTHLHSDHVVGLPDLWLTGWLFGRASTLRIVGPPGTVEMIAHLQRAFAFDVEIRSKDEGLRSDGANMQARNAPPGIVYERRGLKVTGFMVDHGPVRPAFGYRIDFDGRSVVLSGDTRVTDAVIEHARGADVLVHEVVSPEVERRRSALVDRRAVERVLAHHTSPEECGRIFAKVRPRLAVYSHIVPSPTTADDLIGPTRQFYDGPLAVGHDLMMITISDRIDVTTRAGTYR